MKVFGDPESGQIQLLVDGNYVVNGDWHLTVSADGKEGRCLVPGHRSKGVTYFLADVPSSILKKFNHHDYNGIMGAMEDYLAKSRRERKNEQKRTGRRV